MNRESWGGRYNTVVTYADFEVEFVLPNFSEGAYKDIWVQITGVKANEL